MKYKKEKATVVAAVSDKIKLNLIYFFLFTADMECYHFLKSFMKVSTKDTDALHTPREIILLDLKNEILHIFNMN